jgi:hypothetical protein
MSTFVSLKDSRTGEIILVERVKCGHCGFFIEGPNGHPQCMRRSREKANIEMAEWKRKQELEIQQRELEYQRSRPKSKQQLEEEEYAKEQARFRQQMKLDQRKQRLSQLEDEIKHLKKLIAQDEAKHD